MRKRGKYETPIVHFVADVTRVCSSWILCAAAARAAFVDASEGKLARRAK